MTVNPQDFQKADLECFILAKCFKNGKKIVFFKLMSCCKVFGLNVLLSMKRECNGRERQRFLCIIR